MIFKKPNDELMMNLAIKNNMDLDKVLAAYLTVGNDFFLLLHIFQGQTLKIPSDRRMVAANSHNVYFIEDNKMVFKDVVKGDAVAYKGQKYLAVGSLTKVLNHYYLPVTQNKNDLNDDIGE